MQEENANKKQKQKQEKHGSKAHRWRPVRLEERVKAKLKHLHYVNALPDR